MSTSPPSCVSDEVSSRLNAVRARIERAGGDRERIRVIGVTKGFGPDAVEAARGAGLRDIGENYAGELVEKAGLVGSTTENDPGDTRWHFLGTVQRNKVAELAPIVGMWQSVARVVEGERIARFAPGASVLVQVDTTGLAGRNGCPPDQVAEVVGGLRALELQVAGLMTVAAPGPVEVARASFEAVAHLADDLGLEERSMGMSDDLEAAVAAGTTMVRIGRALFGERPPRHSEGAA